MTRPAPRRADGFTMVELIMAVAILGVISVSIGAVGVVMFRTMNQTQDRLEETRGPRFAAVYWVPDVASTETVNPTGVTCGSGGTNLVTLQWNDYKTGDTRVTYATTVNATKTQLVRRLCTNGSTTATRTTVISPSVAASNGAVVTCGDGTTYAACATPDTDKSLLLSVQPKGGGTAFTIDAYREVTDA